MILIATFANYINVHPQITWRKLAALADGARRAGRRLAATHAATKTVQAG